MRRLGRAHSLGSLLFVALLAGCGPGSGGASAPDGGGGAPGPGDAGNDARPLAAGDGGDGDGSSNDGGGGAGGDGGVGSGSDGGVGAGTDGGVGSGNDGGAGAGNDGGGAAGGGAWEIVGGRHYTDIASAWMSGPDDVWAVTGDGALIRSEGPWLVVTAADPVAKEKIFGSGPDDVWVLGRAYGGDSVSMHFDGGTWTTSTLLAASEGTVTDMFVSSPTDMWAVGTTSASPWTIEVLHSDGTSWSGLTAPQQCNDLPRLWGTAGDPDVWLVCGDGGGNAPTGSIFHAGAWKPFEVGSGELDPELIFGTSPTDLWLADSLAVWHSDGTSWTASDTLGQSHDVGTVSGLALAPDDVWIGEMVNFDHFDGTTWTSFPAPSDETIRVEPRVLAGVTGDVRAFGQAGRMRWDGAAWDVTWNDAVGSTPADYTAFACVAPDDCFAAGGVAVQRWNGAGWTNSVVGEYGGIAATSASDAWAVGFDGGHAHFDGATWTTAPAIGGDHLTAVWGSSPSDYWAVGGTALEHYDGAGWTNIPAVNVTVGTGSGAVGLTGVWGSAANDVYAVGSLQVTGAPSVVLHFDGTTWSGAPGVPAAGALNAIWGLGANDVYVAGDAGTLLHFDGATWSSIATGDTGSFRAVWASGAGDIWVGSSVTNDSRLLHFDGVAWTRVAVPGLEPAVAVAAFGGMPGAWWAGTNAGDLLRLGE